jgi:hypothetical protein
MVQFLRSDLIPIGSEIVVQLCFHGAVLFLFGLVWFGLVWFGFVRSADKIGR